MVFSFRGRSSKTSMKRGSMKRGMRASRSANERVGVEGGRVADDERDHDVVVAVDGPDPERGALDDVGVLGHELLHLEARDVLAAAADAVAHAVDEGVPTVGVDLEGVAVWNQPLRQAAAVSSGAL